MRTPTDYKGYKDHPLFTRMPHAYLSQHGDVEDVQFDAFVFPVKDGRPIVTQRVEGHRFLYFYRFDPAAGSQPSPLQIIRN
jgi:hypothetical protein